MKKWALFILCFSLIIVSETTAQVAVTVTNPGNTTPNLATGYTSLANAVTAVNTITAMSGPVILTCAAGTETAPAGGYSINNPGGTSATNTITFTTGGTVTITASASLTVGSLTDAIFKLIGADYIIISGFTMKENAANTTTAGASNNMTEWGVALLYASTANGSQHNTIQNNAITLDRTYTNSFGIYSNTRHSATNTTAIVDIANNTTAPNSNNKFYGNTISNVNSGITLIGSGIAVNQDMGNDIGGSSAVTGNTITNWGGDAAASGFVYNAIGICGIFENNQCNENVSYNTVVSTTLTLASLTTLAGIDKFYNVDPVGAITSTISHNSITLKDNSTATFTFVNAIRSGGITGSASNATINLNDNIILNCSETGVSSVTGWAAIQNYAAPAVLNMNNNIIKGITSTTTAGFSGIYNTGAVTTAININNNQLGVAGSGFFGYTVPTAGSITGIFSNNATSTCTLNINGNSIDGISAQNCGTVYGIYSGGFSGPSINAININNNQLGSVTGTFASFSAAQSNSVFGIANSGGDATTTLLVQNNDIRGIVHSVAGTCTHAYIVLTGTIGSQTVSGNTFTGITANTTGGVNFISGPGTMTSTGTWTCTNNSIAGTFNKTGTGGTVIGINTGGSSPTGSAITATGNNFSNLTLTGSTNFFGILDQAGSFSSGPAKIFTGNTFSNITYGSGTAYGISFEYGLATTCSSNTITGFNGTGNFTGISVGSSISGNANCANNTISNITTTSIFYGVTGGATSIPTFNINGNSINSITCPNSTVIYITAGPAVNIYDNTISGLTSSSAAANLRGIHILNCSASNVYRNKLYGFGATATASGGSPFIYGMFFNSVVATTVNVYNNFVANFTAPDISGTDVIRGIHIGSNTASTTYNVFYNSIYFNAGSTGTDFGTCALYHLVNATSTINTLNLINNIIVNTSTPAGMGKTAAFRRSSSVSLANYGATSDHNLFFAGTPSASRLIYYDGVNSDQTLSAFQTRVNPRDANDITTMPNFTSAADLHLTTANCFIDGKGIAIGGYTTDIDNASRNATTPDIGADEFNAAAGTVLAGINGAATCDYKTVSGTGTTYTTNSCGLIGYILPSGAAPVSGYINACVTLDATQQSFNGEPYVQRHYDIEPVVSNQTTTSATITLYFTDAEFVNYNTLNSPVWPLLPTVANGANSSPYLGNVKVTQFHGVASTSPSTPGNYPGASVLINPGAANVFWNGNNWEVSFSVTGFSGFYVHTNFTNTPLPVVVNYLTGKKMGDDHLLNWKVSCTGSAGITMSLERSADTRNFTGIYTIAATALRCQQPFDHTDTDPLKGMNYYRIKIIDADGKITYSTTVALLNAVKGFDIISIAPNPVVDGNFKLNITSAQLGKMGIAIFDMQGRLVNTQTITIIAGFNSLPVHVNDLSPGTYTIKGNIADEPSRVLRFIKQ